MYKFGNAFDTYAGQRIFRANTVEVAEKSTNSTTVSETYSFD